MRYCEPPLEPPCDRDEYDQSDFLNELRSEAEDYIATFFVEGKKCPLYQKFIDGLENGEEFCEFSLEHAEVPDEYIKVFAGHHDDQLYEDYLQDKREEGFTYGF